MQTYELLVKGRSISANSRDTTLVRTSVGIDRVHVLFDNDEWLGFPVTITFSQGDDVITQSLTMTEIDDTEWVAEGYVVVPFEVIDMVGQISVTIQGTDSAGNHIITSKASPLSVEEAGDVDEGDPPQSAPSVDQWSEAYADAVAAANSARAIVDNIRSRVDAMLAEVEARVQELIDSGVIPATSESLGVVQVGSGLDVTEEGVLSVSGLKGLTDEQESAIENLSALAYYAFDTEFDEDGTLKDGVKIKDDVLPIASTDRAGIVYPDGITITVDDDGMLHSESVCDVATTDSAGIVRPDGTTITIDADGTIHGSSQVSDATTTTKGVVQVNTNGGLTINDGVLGMSLATNAQYGSVRVPNGTSNGIYTSSGYLYTRNASTFQVGSVKLKQGGGIVGSNGVIEVANATNVSPGKVVPDGETLAISNGKLGVLKGASSTTSTDPFRFADIEYVSLVLAADGVAAFTDAGSAVMTGTLDGSAASIYVSLPNKMARVGDVADEVRIYSNLTAFLIRRTAAMRFEGSPPCDLSTGYNLAEYQRYWSQKGIYEDADDFRAYYIDLASELANDHIVTDEDADAYFAEHPHDEVLVLDEPIVMSCTTGSYQTESTYSVTAAFVTGYGGMPSLDWHTVTTTYETGFPVATSSSLGMARPDGTTITVSDGVLTAVGVVGPHLEIRTDSGGNRRLAIVIPEEGE